MKNKSSIIISSIAACAIFVSAFAFNGFAVGETKAAGQNVETQKVESIANVVKPNDTQQLIKTLNNSKPEVQETKTTTEKEQATPVSTATTKNSTNCPTKNNQQTTNNSSDIKNQVQTILNNANINSDVQSKLQTIINSSNCNGKTANNANYSAIKAKLDSLLKSLGGSTATKSDPNTNITSKPAAPSTSAPSTSKPATSTPSTTNGDYSAFQKRVVELVNAERAKNGLKPLTMNAELSKVATLKSQDMAKNNYFDHNSPTYGSPFDMMKKFGISYRTAGENIAMGQTTPEQVMEGWMNSPGHRANILKASFTQIGVGIAKNSSGRLYWTQQFIG